MPYKVILNLLDKNSDMDRKITLERTRYLIGITFKIHRSFVSSILREMNEMDLIVFENRRHIKIVVPKEELDLF